MRGGAPIGGATASSYTTTDADAGTGVQCEVTARNPIGATVATSAPVVPVADAAPGGGGGGSSASATAPTNTQRPAIVGGLSVGVPVSCTPGGWTGSPSFAFAWLRDGVPIAGAVTAFYTPTGADAAGGHEPRGRDEGRSRGGQEAQAQAPPALSAAPATNTSSNDPCVSAPLTGRFHHGVRTCDGWPTPRASWTSSG